MAEQLLQGLKVGEGKDKQGNRLGAFYEDGTPIDELPAKHQKLARDLGIVGEPARVVVGDAELAAERDALAARVAELEAALEEANADSPNTGDSGDA